MHSTIYKLQPDLTVEFDPIREWDYEDNGFLNAVGDYVDEDTDWKDDYEWLSESKEGELWTVKFGGSIKIEKGEEEVEAPVAYLTVNIAKAKQWLVSRAQEIADAIKEDLMKAFSYEVEQLILGDKLGFYFDVNGAYYTDVEFIKQCVNRYGDEEEVTFRLEGTLDYHS